MAAVASAEEPPASLAPDTVRAAMLGATGLLLALWWLLGRQSLQRLPPGPRPWPLVGNLAFALLPKRPHVVGVFAPRKKEGKCDRAEEGRPMHVMLTGLAKMYGSIFRIDLGSQHVIVLNDFEAVRDALVAQAEIFSDRPSVPLVAILTEKKGNGAVGRAVVRRGGGFDPFRLLRAAGARSVTGSGWRRGGGRRILSGRPIPDP